MREPSTWQGSCCELVPTGYPTGMPFYAQRPDLRARQLAADLGMVAWTALWVAIARGVRSGVLALAAPGRAVAGLGRSVAGDMRSAADAARDVPLVGNDLARPFRSLGQAGSSVSGAGQAAQDDVGRLALLLAVVLVLLPVGWLLLRWLPWRLRFARDARAARRLLAGVPDVDVLAARALATAPLPLLAALPSGTAAAWRNGDPDAARALAQVELTRLGLRLPVRPSASSPLPR